MCRSESSYLIVCVVICVFAVVFNLFVFVCSLCSVVGNAAVCLFGCFLMCALLRVWLCVIVLCCCSSVLLLLVCLWFLLFVLFAWFVLLFLGWCCYLLFCVFVLFAYGGLLLLCRLLLFE